MALPKPVARIARDNDLLRIGVAKYVDGDSIHLSDPLSFFIVYMIPHRRAYVNPMS